jgi:hypothetical protein
VGGLSPGDDRGRPRPAKGLIFIVPPIVKGRPWGGPVVAALWAGDLKSFCDEPVKAGHDEGLENPEYEGEW